MPSDGHYQSPRQWSAGAEGTIVWKPFRSFRLGLGLRYELAHGSAPSAIDDHLLSLPLLIGGAVPLSGRHELEILVGAVPMVGLVDPDNVGDGASRFLHVYGLGAELQASYWIPASATLDVSIGAVYNLSLFWYANGGSNGEGFGFRVVLPLRVGVRWS